MAFLSLSCSPRQRRNSKYVHDHSFPSPQIAAFREVVAGSADGRVVMERMVALIVERPVAACAGVVGIFCLAPVLWPAGGHSY